MSGWTIEVDEVNVWRTVEIKDGQVVAHGPPIAEHDLQLGESVYVLTLVGLRRMAVIAGEGERQFMLEDAGCFGSLFLTADGHWHSPSLFNKRALQQLRVGSSTQPQQKRGEADE